MMQNDDTRGKRDGFGFLFYLVYNALHFTRARNGWGVTDKNMDGNTRHTHYQPRWHHKDGRTDGQIYPAHYYEPHNGNGYTYIHTNILTYPAPQGQLMRHAFPPRGSDP